MMDLDGKCLRSLSLGRYGRAGIGGTLVGHCWFRAHATMIPHRKKKIIIAHNNKHWKRVVTVYMGGGNQPHTLQSRRKG